MSEEHTKGEWITNGTVIQDENGDAIAQVWPKTSLASEKSIALMKANARLIAAAPNLLKACEKLLILCKRFNQHEIDCATQSASVADEFAAMGCTCGISKAEAAISKATK